MAYETVGVVNRPYEISERLAGVPRSRCETDCDLWTFDLLREPLLRDWAIGEAADADMVVIAACGDAELPDYVKTWIEHWLLQRGEKRSILVGILDKGAGTSREAPRLCAYLRQMAEKQHMPFFCNADRLWQSDVRHRDEIMTLSAEGTLPEMAEVFHQPPTAGGGQRAERLAV
jgi:hypothetical protein